MVTLTTHTPLYKMEQDNDANESLPEREKETDNVVEDDENNDDTMDIVQSTINATIIVVKIKITFKFHSCIPNGGGY